MELSHQPLTISCRFFALFRLRSAAYSRSLSQVVEDGYEFFAKRHLVTLFSAPNYCGEFDNAGAMMSVDETLLCSFQVRQLVEMVGLHLTRP